MGLKKVIIELNKLQYDNFKIFKNNSKIDKKELINEISKKIE